MPPSNTKRVEANGLYQAMGFERYETNCNKLKISCFKYDNRTTENYIDPKGKCGDRI